MKYFDDWCLAAFLWLLWMLLVLVRTPAWELYCDLQRCGPEPATATRLRIPAFADHEYHTFSASLDTASYHGTYYARFRRIASGHVFVDYLDFHRTARNGAWELAGQIDYLMGDEPARHRPSRKRQLLLVLRDDTLGIEGQLVR